MARTLDGTTGTPMRLLLTCFTLGVVACGQPFFTPNTPPLSPEPAPPGTDLEYQVLGAAVQVSLDFLRIDSAFIMPLTTVAPRAIGPLREPWGRRIRKEYQEAAADLKGKVPARLDRLRFPPDLPLRAGEPAGLPLRVMPYSFRLEPDLPPEPLAVCISPVGFSADSLVALVQVGFRGIGKECSVHFDLLFARAQNHAWTLWTELLQAEPLGVD
jgi:hypothetical protein